VRDCAETASRLRAAAATKLGADMLRLDSEVDWVLQRPNGRGVGGS
jgi:hypothetical protein